MKYIPVGVDIAKHLMQVHFVDEHTGEIIDSVRNSLNISATVNPALSAWRPVGVLITGRVSFRNWDIRSDYSKAGSSKHS
ncbi:transposase [Escherichia coli]|nr:transposase [Escherichia coli]GCR07129.1 transposase [Escherichia coli]